MTRLGKLRGEVDSLYRARNPRRAEWADWLYSHHVHFVADRARELAVRFGANPDLAQASGMLHDIADAVMAREDSRHEEVSLSIARELLVRAGFSDEEIRIIVDDAIRLHGCHGGRVPYTPEGRVMATADAVTHLTTDFYDFSLRTLLATESMEVIRAWALPKIERDFNSKICFQEMRGEVWAGYLRCKSLFR